jgi:predicted MFS family arabinose efflux permease
MPNDIVFGIEPWIQFVVLVFLGGGLVGAIVRGIVRSVRHYESTVPGKIALIVLLPLLLYPLGIGAYLAYYHVYGWWNLGVWLCVSILYQWIIEEGKRTAGSG